MPHFRKGRRLLTAALAVAFLLPARASWADPEAWFKKGLLAYEDGHFAEAAQAADNGYLEKKLPKLLLLKAMAKHKLGLLDDAWTLLQLIVPKELPEHLRETFVQEYSQVEMGLKQAALDRDHARATAAQDRIAQQAQRDAVAQRAAAKSSRARTLWIGAGATAVVGSGLWALGWSTAHSASDPDLTQASNHAQYHDTMSLGRMEYWGGVGLVAVAAGLATWAAIESAGAGEPAAPTVTLAPVWWPQGAGVVLTVSDARRSDAMPRSQPGEPRSGL